MNLQLVNLFSLALTAVSLLIFFVSFRKANRLMAMSRAVAQQVAGSAASLEQALSVLRTEREICRDESVRLEARLKDSDRARSEIARAIDLVKLAKVDLKANAVPFPAPAPGSAQAIPAFVAKSAPVPPVQAGAPARNVPVFVNRIVRSADVASAVL
ncbi:hypothetical protein CU102_14730 [Phyllobacterium brassicacearum]|uniref:Uncharacterized protein n=1 Tax=Phyllobacterium brassicacearum TaxID=314235 RepID=A0A2P7BP13_9HYPH|nr:hypothetical protein [Phyllobacterium brassicacearum]PSH68175.1 hypothetical protein CU102_14730 [Phyllobacterium brassicacearum]TDQ29590.1 hypothetical protein DEV91_10998 [Phyllobacterium brassicacearum]